MVRKGDDDALVPPVGNSAALPDFALAKQGLHFKCNVVHCLFLPPQWGAGPMALMLWLNLVI
jgi:hypothetical protein